MVADPAVGGYSPSERPTNMMPTNAAPKRISSRCSEKLLPNPAKMVWVVGRFTEAHPDMSVEGAQSLGCVQPAKAATAAQASNGAET